MNRFGRVLTVGTCAALATMVSAGPAFGAFVAQGNAGTKGYALGRSLPGGPNPSMGFSSNMVTVTFNQVTFDGSHLGAAPGGGYRVQRYNGSGTAQTMAGGCAAVVSGPGASLSCIETGVPVGTWTYGVVPQLQNWRGAESTRVSVTVGPPTVTGSSLFDTDHNGRIDRITVTFSRNVSCNGTGGACTASRWTLTTPPSGASVSSVSVSGATATLTLTQGTNNASIDTEAADLRVNLATGTGGITDSGFQASFTGVDPADKAEPIFVSLTDDDTSGSDHGTFQANDLMTITFSEKLAPTWGSTTTVNAVLARTSVSGIAQPATLDVPSMLSGTTGDMVYLGSGNSARSVTFTSTVLTNVQASKAVTIKLGTCSGSDCSNVGRGQGSYSFTANTALVDTAGNVVANLIAGSNYRLF